ncbi:MULTISPECIES: NDP-hexose 2,3-dehydratase family protein [unclassified Nocardia]|uniref:NDP-hexose 2,3-dehydratase family protein n=1 Tax=unclassified Nocardia TaxID=2637762 RepID=UPI001CE3ED44|nr:MULTISPECIES: NDP-hexose 2,3-dehydratase family protein [unclassified Nocardia]
MFEDLTEFHDWFADRECANDYKVSVVSLDALNGWQTDPRSGDIHHRSGRFFSVIGLRVATESRTPGTWSQPIIRQPEIGILGIIAKRVGGTLYCLMQAKMEPGNVNLIQLSPTVQATRSNYTRVHQGSPVPYLEYFLTPRRGRPVFDSLQSEQGSWFLGKRNRNMIVEVDEDIPVLADFCWLSVRQLAELIRVPNLVSMDSRTVLSGIPFLLGDPRDRGWRAAKHSLSHILSWFTEVKAQHQLERTVVPLNSLPDWERSGGMIHRPDRRFFSVLGVDVHASNREVRQWSQPMLRPAGRGVIAFLGRHFDGVFHVLVYARTEAGTGDVVEMAPTVSCIPDNYVGVPDGHRPRYLDLVLAAAGARILVDVVHSEEGGRFYHAENRYLVVDVGDDLPADVPRDYCWMTPEQLTGFIRYGNHVNVGARCLLSCMTETAVAFTVGLQ